MMKIAHSRLSLALHPLREGTGTALLLLHELQGSAADWDGAQLPWPGAVYALDFSGHGRSGRLYGGGYYPELWAADADAALSAINREVVVVGAGVGAYCALLLAGARPQLVQASVLLPGAGLDGIGAEPDFANFPAAPPAPEVPRELVSVPHTDPAVHVSEFAARVPGYAEAFARQARRTVLVEDSAQPAPQAAWWRALSRLSEVDVHVGDLERALQRVAAH